MEATVESRFTTKIELTSEEVTAISKDLNKIPDMSAATKKLLAILETSEKHEQYGPETITIA
jgi:DNA anti-recombination protein RmuC